MCVPMGTLMGTLMGSRWRVPMGAYVAQMVGRMARRWRVIVVSHGGQMVGRMVGRMVVVCRARVGSYGGQMVGDMRWRKEKERSGMLCGMFRNVRRHRNKSDKSFTQSELGTSVIS
jgi:hypothetical protein